MPDKDNYKDLKMHLTNFAINSADNKKIKNLDGIKSKMKLTSLLKLLSKNENFFTNETVRNMTK